MPVSRDEFLQQRAAIRGEANPQPMRFALWEELVRSGESAWHAGQRYGSDEYPTSPGWCFDRFGMSRTRLPDGRIICIAGEHEDHYDPDFFIYNDVIVIQPDGTPDICGYSKESFLPTDFHAATLVGDAIFIIGGLGYPSDRGKRATPVHRLDLASMRIDRLAPTGSSPAWIFGHRAEIAPDGVSIRIGGGEISAFDSSGTETLTKNEQTFSFNAMQNTWSRTAGVVPTLTSLPADKRLLGWTWLEDPEESQKLQNAILRAAAPDHPLFCQDFWPFAEQSLCKIAFRMLDGSDRFGVCDYPDIIGREEPPGLQVTFFATLAELVGSVATSA